MANNRMYLACAICLQKEETKLEDCILYICKYYPNTGWYLRSDKATEWIDEWLDEHKHASKVSRPEDDITYEQAMYGEYIILLYESHLATPEVKDKRGVLAAVTNAMNKP